MKNKLLILLLLLSTFAYGQTQISTSQIKNGAVTGPKLGTTSSAQLATALTDEEGSGGGFVRATAPTITNAALVTPNIGTPTAGVATNITGLPVSTGISGLGTGVAGALANSANGAGGFVTNTGTVTLTNKRLTPRVQSVTSSATVTPSWDNDDAVKITAQAAGLTIADPSGTPDPMQLILIRIKDNGTARPIAWGSSYRAIGFTLPTTTVLGKVLYIGIIRNTDESTTDVLFAKQLN